MKNHFSTSRYFSVKATSKLTWTCPFFCAVAYFFQQVKGFLYVFCTLFCLYACSPEETVTLPPVSDPTEPTLKLTKTEALVSASSGHLEIGVKASQLWHSRTTARWVRSLIIANDSTLQIGYYNNPLSVKRETIIRLSIDTLFMDFTLIQDKVIRDNVPDQLPTSVANALGSDDSIYVLTPTVLIAKAGRYRSTVSITDVIATTQGWAARSINPILLQMGITLDRNNMKLYYVDLPSDFEVHKEFHISGTDCNPATTGPFYVTDLFGERIKKGDGTDSTFSLDCHAYRILIGKGLHGIPNPGGASCCWIPRKWTVSRSIVLNEGASSNVLAHEIGHTLGLEHSDQNGQACDFTEENKFLMRAITFPESVLLKDCEKKIATSRAEENDQKFRGIHTFLELEKQFPLSIRAMKRKRIGAPGSPDVIDLTQGWRFISNPELRKEYVRNVTYYTNNPEIEPSTIAQSDACKHGLQP